MLFAQVGDYPARAIGGRGYPHSGEEWDRDVRGKVMWQDYGLGWSDGIRIVVSAVAVYVLMLVAIRLLGQRVLASLSSFDLAAVLALGAVMGRAMLGNTPTLVAGIIALSTLMILQAGTGQLRRRRRGAVLTSNRPVVLMAGSQFLRDNMARCHVVEEEVGTRLRLAGIRSLEEVACVILEPTAQISVLRRGVPIDRRLVEAALGAERIPGEFLG